jgi:hypothetical protein
MTTLETKMGILHDLVIYGDEEYAEFLEVHDLGCPLAMLVIQGQALATEAGVVWIEKDYADLCEFLEIDVYGDYDSLEEMEEYAKG